MKLLRKRSGPAVAMTAVALLLALAAPSSVSATAGTTADPNQYTRQTLDLTGTWELTATFTSRFGQPIAPGSMPGDDDFVALHLWTGQYAPPGNEPVYMGSVYDAATKQIRAGEVMVSPYVSPRGIVFTVWQAGNPEGFADAYEAVFTLQSRNDTRTPLQATGTWLDQDHNGGTATLRRRPDVVLP